GSRLGRGIFSRSRHARGPAAVPTRVKRRRSVPVDLPGFVLNRLSVAGFNAIHWRVAGARSAPRVCSYDPVFYPLDGIADWNRLYGHLGFFQYQCAIPTARAFDATERLLSAVTEAGQASFLSVLKTLGEKPSPGMLSFPLPGVTLALDF